MKKIPILLSLIFLMFLGAHAQDTFSIVATDPATGEVGSAGASCVALTNFNLPPDFLGELFPGEGAINTQAYYLDQNQANARNRMNAGDSPQEIIDWLVANDVQNNPSFRQYGVVRIINDEPFSAAHTGNNTDDYKGHRTGPTYSIQGNILLGPEILDSMEDNFLNTEGTLAEKLMAALQGANVVGADTRCTSNGTSSLFAFLKVAQPDDEFGSPSLVLGVDFPDNSTMEPIDSLQNLFDAEFTSSNQELIGLKAKLYPNPAVGETTLELEGDFSANDLELVIFDALGHTVFNKKINSNKISILHSSLGSGNLFIYQIRSKSKQAFASGKIMFLK